MLNTELSVVFQCTEEVEDSRIESGSVGFDLR